MLLAVHPSVRAQEPESGESSLIYRARQATQYALLYNGTYFWDATGFHRGDVFYSGRLYRDLSMNIDAAEQQLVIGMKDGRPMVSPRRDLVEWFTMDGVLFLNLGYMGVEGAPAGFCEVLFSDGKTTFLRQVTKHLHSVVGDHNGDEIGYEDPNYRDEVLSFFKMEQAFFVFREGILTQVKSRRDLLRLFPGEHAHMRKAARDAGLARRDVGLRYWGHAAIASVCGPEVVPVPEERLFGADLLHGGEHYTLPPDENPKPYDGPVMKVLPGGWFSDDESRRNSDLMRYIDESNIIATFRNKVYNIGRAAEGSRAAKARITGIVRDVSTKEPLPGVSVYDDNTRTYALTDAQGRYELSLKTGENVLNFSEYSKEDMKIHVVVNADGSFDVMMKERSEMLDEARVSAFSRFGHRTTRMGIEKMDIKEIGKIPSAFGEGDVLKAVLTLPGVKSTGEASGGFNVRGGSTDQNLILFNGNTIYNPSHLFGIFSAFNPDVVDNVELYKSSMPAEFGGRISSVLDVHGRDGSSEKFTGSAGIGLLTSRLHVEGPLGESGRTTFLLGGRTTYSDWMMGLLPKSSGYSNGRADFSDAHATIAHKFSDRSSLHLYAYWSRDKFGFSGDTTFHYSNLNASMRFDTRLGERTSLALAAGYDQYGNDVSDHSAGYDAYNLQTAIRQAFGKATFRTKGEKHSLTYGAGVTAYALDGGIISPYGDISTIVGRSLGTETAIEPALFLSDEWQLTQKFSIDAGVRMAAFANPAAEALYTAPELRLSAKYTFTPDFSLKAGFGTADQFIHLITNTTSISPMDTWKLCDADLKPQKGWQASAGVYRTILGGKVDVSLEGYWKQVSDYLDYRTGATLVMNDHLADDVVPTFARAYGAELMIRKSTGNLTGWLSYTYSRAFLREMHDRGLLTINRGEWYRAPHDKPHDVKLVGLYRFTRRYSLSFNLDYSTGRPVTIPVGSYFYDGGYRLAYSDRNSYRIPDYFRMDVGINIEPSHYLRQLTHTSFTIGCYNVTGRKNAYSVFFTTDGGSMAKAYMVSVFAVPIPYVNIDLKF